MADARTSLNPTDDSIASNERNYQISVVKRYGILIAMGVGVLIGLVFAEWWLAI